MFKITIYREVPPAFEIAGKRATALLANSVWPVSATVVASRSPAGGPAQIELTFEDRAHAKDWMYVDGMSDKAIKWHLDNGVVID